MTHTDRYHGLIVFAALLACELAPNEAGAQAAPPSAQAGQPAVPAAPGHAPVPRSQRGEQFYMRRFGVDDMHVRYTASGASLEFRYRVVDAEKAKILTDKKSNPRMVDVATGTVLTVPTMEKIGALRQTATPEVGREYWMLFSNPGKRVKQGQRVNVAIGTFHVEGLVVE